MTREKFFHIYWGGVLVALPFWIRPTSGPWLELSRDLFFLFSVLLSCFLFGGATRFNKMTPYFLGIMALAFFNQFNWQRDEVVYQTLFLFAGFIFINQASSIFKKSHQEITYRSLMAVSFLTITWLLLEVIGIEPAAEVMKHFGVKLMRWDWTKWVEDTTVFINGPFANTNQTGALIALTLPVFIEKLPLIGIALAALSLALMGSMGAVVSAMTGIVFYFCAKFLTMKANKKLFTLTLLAIPIGMLFLPKYGVLGHTGRFEAWKVAFGAVSLTDLIIGNGLGWIASILPSLYVYQGHVIFDKLHSEYLEVIFAFGIVGAYFFYKLIFEVFNKQTLNPVFYAIFCASLVNSFVNFTYHITTLALIGLVSYAYLTKKECENGLY